MIKDLLQTLITANEAQILAINNALIALSSGIQTYRLDTGQNITNVTRFDINDLNNTLQSLINQNSIYCNRLNGRGTIIGRPAC
ncbi:MAG: hypothetical protein IMY67_12510 [Bacteroidetes bacterium]|nr:hypothetical protein [Bacteroidota bacterium]